MALDPLIPPIPQFLLYPDTVRRDYDTIPSSFHEHQIDPRDLAEVERMIVL